MKTRQLLLRGPTLLLIDWANVYGWQRSLGKRIEIKNVATYFHLYPEITERRFYFGTDKHPASTEFLAKVERQGFTLITKPVKYIQGRRKCDFDVEIAVDALSAVANYRGFIFMSGDGDFAYLYRYLLKLGKQVVVVYAHGHLGKEVYQLRHGLYKISYEKLFIKNAPRRKPRA